MIFSALTDFDDVKRCLRVTGTVVALMVCLPRGASANPTGLVLAPEELKFGKQTVNSASAQQSVTVSNNGAAAVELYQIISSGVDFRQSNDCPAKLLPAASCSISVVFQPAIDGPREGAVIIFGSDGSAPHTIVVKGVGE